MKKAHYIGPILAYQGQSALLRREEAKSGIVLVQFDDLVHFHELAHGWHEFSEKDWEVYDDPEEVREDCNERGSCARPSGAA